MNCYGYLPGRGATRRAGALALVAGLLGLANFTGHAAGTVISWGGNAAGQCDVPFGLAEVIAVAAGESHSLALKSDGTVVGWGFDVYGQASPPPDLRDVIAIVAGSSYSLALKADGTVVQWGSMTPVPQGLSDVNAIAAGFDHALALTGSGHVVAWGSETSVPASATNVIALAAGMGHSLALRLDGTVVAWGDDSFQKATVPPGVSNIVAIAAGQDHSLALRADGTVVAWGANFSGQLEIPLDLTNAVAISAGAAHNLALRADGSLAAWGDNSNNQATVNPAQTDFFGIAAGGLHSLALKGSGAPAILVRPLSQTVFAGKDVQFEVSAFGAAPLFYQWRLNGIDIAGATGSSLTVTNAQLPEAGAYTVVVGNALGSVVSPVARLTLLFSPPFLTADIQDQFVVCGDPQNWELGVGGSGPFACQWFFQDHPVANATNFSLILTNTTPADAGVYWAVVANSLGAITSHVATLTLEAKAPLLVGVVPTNAIQGFEFNFPIPTVHGPTWFEVSGLPAGLTFDPLTGVISGMPLESGAFAPVITMGNACMATETNLMLTVDSVVPYVFYLFNESATEGEYAEIYSNWMYYYRYPPRLISTENLPPGLTSDELGNITGTPLVAGEYYSTVTIGNDWGTDSGTVYINVSSGAVNGLSMDNFSFSYASPYLLDFEFDLLDNDTPALGNAVVVSPKLLSATCLENGEPISASESGYFIDTAAAKVMKTYLVLDFSRSIASLANGDTNRDGISDAVDFMVSGAQAYVNQQPGGTLIGLYEFHRDDKPPAKVLGLTTDKAAVNQAIAGIWTNYVKGFPAGSRCWDALKAAVADLGRLNPDEQHTVLCVSDGQDESSLATFEEVTDLASSNRVSISCVGFGAELDAARLQTLADLTGGRYLTAATSADLELQFAYMGKANKGRYVLRWATLRRGDEFPPTFQISFQGFTATTPADTVEIDTNAPPEIDTNTVPPTTNYPYVTNSTFDAYDPNKYKGDVTIGSLRLFSEAEVSPPAISLRATYVPRYIRQLRLHYRPNWPCTPSLLSTRSGQLLYGWTGSQTNDGAGGYWVLLSSPNPQEITNSLPFAAMGNLVRFTFRDLVSASNAFSMFEVDNTIYTNTGDQSFVIPADNLAAFVSEYPVLPYGTPVPWLMANGFTGDFEAAEVSDPDNDGVPTWKEFVANTNPRDPVSHFVLLSATRLPNHRFQVTFDTVANRFYRLELSTNMFTWETNLARIYGSNSVVTATDVTPHPRVKQIYYRVGVY